MQLTLVRQNLYSDVFAMDNPLSIMIVIEALGYGFMGLATLSTAFVFTNGKVEKAIRWLFIFNGILGVRGDYRLCAWIEYEHIVRGFNSLGYHHANLKCVDGYSI